VPDQTLVDMQVAWDADILNVADASWLRGLKLTLGVSNLFDEEPRFAEIGSSSGFDLSQGDLRQRFGYINLTKRF
jgi:outer membrane receptor protein involved in Fe transport